MESLNILHLSDLHFGNFKGKPATSAIDIVKRLNNEGKKVDVVLVSGDVFDGRSRTAKQDEKDALKFFEVLIKKLNSKEVSNKIDEKGVLFVPGNHDLIRKEDGTEQYEKYDSFIEKFYGDKRNGEEIGKKYIIDKYNFIYDFPDKKIAILGFNSCKIEADRVKEKGLKWIEDIDLSDFGESESEKIKDKIREYKEEEISWDDFGDIDSEEMDEVFEQLVKIIPSYSDYTLIATFHHHFYPFPEGNGKNPDTSFIRNYTEVLQEFQNFNIKLVLHGHKHTPVKRAITDGKYFKDPESIIYVLAAGSIGCKDVDNLSFHWLKVFEKGDLKLVDGLKFDYNNLEHLTPKTITLPPKRSLDDGKARDLKTMLSNQSSKLYSTYQEVTNDFNQTIQDSEVDRIIEKISGIITVFDEVNISLCKVPSRIFIILLAINYRVIFLKNSIEAKSEKLEELLKRLEKEIAGELEAKLEKEEGKKEFAKNLIQFLSATNNEKIDEIYPLITKHVSNKQKEYGAYVSIVLFLTDLYLNISRYGEAYLKNEKLDLAINIKVKKGDFYNSIPSDTIKIKSNPDRRAISIEFNSKNPTVHKIAVLIIKDFEMRLSKFEKSLETINLKLYYISPKVIPEKYDLENFHFDAYIPTLLPLLTGDNLYDQKEVFIRELVQNAIDATLLRKKLQPEAEFNTDIIIELGTERRNGKNKKYFKITDSGVGMSKFTVERYFTSIGRSFYVSDEFKELKKDNKITYNAISNFGIGFLSSFMICKEIVVKTRNISDGESGLEIEIPNYEGCFFVKKIERAEFGTEIILYADDRVDKDGNPLMNFDKFETYIYRVFRGLPLNINVIGEKKFKVPAYKQQEKMLASVKKGQLIFYVPFSEETKLPIPYSWEEFKKSNISSLPKFGVLFNFSTFTINYQRNDNYITCNQGLQLKNSFLPFVNRDIHEPIIEVNYPSSFVQLDVARESINSYKQGVNLVQISKVLYSQVLELVSGSSNLIEELYIDQQEAIYDYIKYQFIDLASSELLRESFVLQVTILTNGLEITIIKNRDIPKNVDEEKYYYFSFRDFPSFSKFFPFLRNLSTTLSRTIFEKDERIKTNNIREMMKMLEQVEGEEIHEIRQMIDIRDMMGTMDMMEEVDMNDVWKIKKIMEQMGRIEMNERVEIGQLAKNIKKIDYGKQFIYTYLLFFRKRKEIRNDYWEIYPLYDLKRRIFLNVKISDYKSFKYTIDFSKYNFKKMKEKFEAKEQ